MIEHDLPFHEYLSMPGNNNSWLREIDKSPLHYITSPSRPRKDTPALRLGRPTHTATLEPARFDESVMIWAGGEDSKGRPTMSKNSSAYKRERTVANEKRLELLDLGQYELCKQISERVRNHTTAGPMLAEGKPEVTVSWQDPDTGVECKARPDWVGPDYILDLKTTRDITEFGFGRAVQQYGYHIQAAFYQDGYAYAGDTGEMLPFYIVAVEKAPPFDVVVYKIPEEVMALGRAIYRSRLRKVAECTETGHWPGIADTPVSLVLPDWAYDHPAYTEMLGEEGDASAL